MHSIVPVSLAVVLLSTGWAHAQVAPSAAASAPAVAPTDRAKRDADKVYQMILMHADKPRRVARDERAIADRSAHGATAPSSARQGAASSRLAAEPDTAPAKVPAPAVAGPGATAASTSAASRGESRPVETEAVVVVAPTSSPPPTPPSPATPAGDDKEVARLPAAAKNIKLELVESVEPEFPSRLLRSLGGGSVVVQFEVQPDGTVVRPEVVRSSHRGLNAAAQAAVAAWRFKPVSENVPGVVELKFE